MRKSSHHSEFIALTLSGTGRYFHLASNKSEPIRLQQGVIRTNCMDNLDRTNVAQAAIAKWTLERQLKELRVIQENDTIDNYEELVRDFRESAHPLLAASLQPSNRRFAVWSDHANFISIAYSGTGALKTDFTRTGKRTRKGLLEDGLNSVMRYLKNNFFDGARQVRVSHADSSVTSLETHLLGMTGCIRSHDWSMVATSRVEPLHSCRRPQAAHHPCGEYLLANSWYIHS